VGFANVYFDPVWVLPFATELIFLAIPIVAIELRSVNQPLPGTV